MVPSPPASVDSAPTAHPLPEVARTLRVLRDYRQLFGVVGLPDGGRAHVAEVAYTPQPRTALDLAPLPPVVGALSSGAGASGPIEVLSRSEPLIRGTVCVSERKYGSVGALGGQPPRATRQYVLWPLFYCRSVIESRFGRRMKHGRNTERTRTSICV